LIFFLTVSTTPGKYKLFTGVNDAGDKFFADVVDTAEQLITGVVDTSDISANFQKNSKMLQWNTWGAWGTLIHEKNLKSKSRVRLPLM
jgi:hypothetical protein